MAPEADSAARAKKMSKQRTLELIKSLEPDDDERTGISKKVSWILRHGAQKANVKMDSEGWVEVSNLLSADILDDVSQETLMAVIVDSNMQKLRYKLRETNGVMYIKAYSKTERKATSGTVGGDQERRAQVGTLRQEAQPFVPSSAFAPGGAPPMGYPWAMAGGFGFPPMMPQWPGAYPMAPFAMEGAAPPPGRYRGWIKSFYAEKGFGFIECAETYAQFNRDVFLHKAQSGDMAVGTEVTFLVETNKQGMPQAKDVAPLGAGGAGAGCGKAGRGKGKGKGKGKGGKEGGKGKGKEGGKEGGKGAAKGGKGAAKEAAGVQEPPSKDAGGTTAAPGDAAAAGAAPEATEEAAGEAAAGAAAE